MNMNHLKLGSPLRNQHKPITIQFIYIYIKVPCFLALILGIPCSQTPLFALKAVFGQYFATTDSQNHNAKTGTLYVPLVHLYSFSLWIPSESSLSTGIIMGGIHLRALFLMLDTTFSAVAWKVRCVRTCWHSGSNGSS